MNCRVFIIGLLVCCLSLRSSAQIRRDLIQSRVLILLDESSSMIQPWAGTKEKYKAAREIILKIMDSVYAFNNEVEFSLRVFGHQHTVKENNCYDTKNEVAFSKSNRTQMELRLTDIHPLGVTPIAYALRQAAENDLTDEVHNAYSIILITDGGESCGGDICEVMRSLVAAKVFFKPYIVGLEDAPELKSTYACMGNYLSVTKQEDMGGAVSKIVEAFKPIIKVTKTEYKEIKELGINAPSILKIGTTIKKPDDTKTITEVKQPAIPVTAAINHLATAPIIITDIAITETAKLSIVTVPPAPIEAITMPLVDKIDHLPTAPLKELEGATTHTKTIRSVVPPAYVEEVSLPSVDLIEHLLPAPLKQLEGTSLHTTNVKQYVVPIATNPILENPDLPTVTKIVHLTPATPKIFDVTPPAPEPLKLVHPITAIVDEVPQLPTVPAIAHLKPAAFKQMELLVASTQPLKLVKPILPPTEERETPTLPIVAGITHLSTAKLKLGSTEPIPPTSLKQVGNNVLSVEVKDIPEKTVTTKINKLRPAHVFEPRVMFLIEDHPLQHRTPPAPPTFTPIPVVAPLTSLKPGFTPAKAPVAPGITSGYTVETVEAKQTTLMVYFTNGHGKFYSSTPQVVLLEPISNKVMKKFYRTIDPAGVPDPQTDIPTGIFNIAIADKRNLVLHDVEIVPNKLNKVIVKLKNCSLVFEYDAAKDRPITEFFATVIERNVANGKITEQKCTQKLEYEPGNYHIIIHSYPKIDRNVDLDFDDTKVINLPQPGFLKITTEMKNRKLILCQAVNDRFLQFDTKISSDTVFRHLQIQPGQYQVRYLKDPTKPYSKETIVPFAIKSNEVTELMLQGN